MHDIPGALGWYSEAFPSEYEFKLRSLDCFESENEDELCRHPGRNNQIPDDMRVIFPTDFIREAEAAVENSFCTYLSRDPEYLR